MIHDKSVDIKKRRGEKLYGEMKSFAYKVILYSDAHTRRRLARGHQFFIHKQGKDQLPYSRCTIKTRLPKTREGDR